MLLASALLRNAAEGRPGRVIGTDINPKAGFLFAGTYSEVGEIMYGDSIESLGKIGQSIDVFINDSDHSVAYERAEYETIETKLAADAVLIADNAHTNDELMRFAGRTDRHFSFFAEKPQGHWYSGGGIGFAWRR